MTLPNLPPLTTRGRGAPSNPTGRFERLVLAPDQAALCEAESDPDFAQGPQLRTEILHDTSKSIVTTNDSPDVGMDASVNPYRGCEHGCIYCYARPTHEYLGFSAGLDFETKILAKPDAAKLLRQKFLSPRYEPQAFMLSSVTDCYQPIERTLKLTRGCLEVMAEFRHPVGIVTKNALVTRDIDLLAQLAEHNAIRVMLSITTLDGKLARTMEPRASRPTLRVQAIETLARAGIPVGVMMGPVLPGLTEHEIPDILKAAADAGARSAYYTMLRLPYGVKDLFQAWLDEHYPNQKNKILNRLRDMHGGKLYDATFGHRMTGQGVYATQIAQSFFLYKKKFGLDQKLPPLSAVAFRRPVPASDQLALPF